MERLTNTAWRNFDPWECCGQDNFCTRGCHEKGGCNNGCIVPKLYGRLASYEDTGLEPEEIKELRELCTDEVAELARTLLDYIESEHICMNPLYGCGFSRVGCIGCPMAGKAGREAEFAMFPKFKAA